VKIYNEGILFGEIKKTFWWKRDRGYFVRMVGINLVQQSDGIHVQPVIVPFLRIERAGKSILIELFTSEPKFLAVLMPFWPFIHVEHLDGTVVANEEEV